MLENLEKQLEEVDEEKKLLQQELEMIWKWYQDICLEKDTLNKKLWDTTLQSKHENAKYNMNLVIWEI